MFYIWAGKGFKSCNNNKRQKRKWQKRKKILGDVSSHWEFFFPVTSQVTTVTGLQKFIIYMQYQSPVKKLRIRHYERMECTWHVYVLSMFESSVTAWRIFSKSVQTISLFFRGICLGTSNSIPRKWSGNCKLRIQLTWYHWCSFYHCPHLALLVLPICCVWVGNEITVSGGH